MGGRCRPWHCELLSVSSVDLSDCDVRFRGESTQEWSHKSLGVVLVAELDQEIVQFAVEKDRQKSTLIS